MGIARYDLRDMPLEHHEDIFRDLFRVFVLETRAGNTLVAELNKECIETIFSADKISSERRLEIEIEVLACLAAARSRVRAETAAA